MPRLVTSAVLDAEGIAATLRPRDSVVLEVAAGDGRFTSVDGPVAGYQRNVTVTDHDGQTVLTQTVEYRLRIPFFSWMFARAFRKELGRLGTPPRGRWWSAPQRLGGEAFTVLGCLALLSVVSGYLSTLMTQTTTFAAQEFHAGKTAQGVALAVVRADILLSVALVAMADRRGRRVIVIWATVAGSALTALGALAPSLAALAASQVVARGFVTAVTITVAVMAAEAMPAGSRAYVLGLLAMASALGVGVAVVALPIAGLGVGAWRILYAAGIAGIPVSLAATRRLPESQRFEHRAPRAPTHHRSSTSRRRLALLATGAFLFNAFSVPASQFQNEYLRHERHFSATQLSLFIVITVVPGALGIIIGGRLADTRGRRGVGSIAAAGSALLAVGFYSIAGWPMWVLATMTAIIGAAVIPALTVYGPELFGTSTRGLSNGWITAAGRVGSIIGLVVVGALASALGRFGPAFGILAVGPLGLAALVIFAFPETARRELEELNPEDLAVRRESS